MSTLVFANNAASTLAGGITNTSLTINLAAGGGAAFPNPIGDQYFVGTLIDAATGLLREIVWCTARAGDVLTVVRAQEGTTALNWQPNDLFQHLWTAGQAGAMQQQSAAPSSLIYYGADTSSIVNQMVATVTPTISALTTGSIFEITPKYANTTSSVSLYLSGLGPYQVYRADGTSLQPGDIQAAPYKALIGWDATASKFLLLNPCLWDSLAENIYVGVDSGTSTAYNITNPIPSVVTLSVGTAVSFRAANASAGGTTTLTLGSSGAKNFYRADGTNLHQNDILANEVVLAVYDGSGYQLSGVVSTNKPAQNIVEYSSPGTFNWTVPSGVYSIKELNCWGGGGGGGGSSGAGTSSSGGGGGGYSKTLNIVVTPGQVIPIIVGAGGAGGVGNASGGTGGDTSFNGSYGAHGGTGGSPNGTNIPGTGGTGFGGSLNLTGQSGGISFAVGSEAGCGFGGAAPFGGGIPTLGLASSTPANGAPGLFPGGGANGGANPTGGGTATGGAGASGFLWFSY